ncbi:MAG: hypothetical protein PVG65_06175, partial [Candidatus Thorarchaeota archaeon]
MNYIESVYEISEQFMVDSKDVYINWEKVNETITIMLESGKREFKDIIEITNQEKYWEIHNECFLQLIGGSINYCYWYGKHNIRPNNCGSGKMFECVRKVAPLFNEHSTFRISDNKFCDSIEELIKILAYARFPLLEEREKHLKELIKYGKKFVDLVMGNIEI